MRELSIFVDESGDFGKCNNNCPFYIISFVLHEQQNSIKEQIKILNQHLLELNFTSNHTIHSGPLIRRESEYSAVDISIRQKIFLSLFYFTKSINITQKTFIVDKRQVSGQFGIMRSIFADLHNYILQNLKYFSSFDNIIIYYDNGQYQLTQLLVNAFDILLGNNYEFRAVSPNDYKLFQAADFICTLTLIKTKLDNNKKLTKSELNFFGSPAKLRKNYFKFLDRIKFN